MESNISYDPVYDRFVKEILTNPEYKVVPYVLTLEEREALYDYDVSPFLKRFKKGTDLEYLNQWTMDRLLGKLHPELLMVVLRNDDNSILFPCANGYEFRTVVVNTDKKLISPVYHYACPNSLVSDEIYKKLPRAVVKAWARATWLSFALWSTYEEEEGETETNVEYSKEDIAKLEKERSVLVKIYNEHIKNCQANKVNFPSSYKIDPQKADIVELRQICFQLKQLQLANK